MKANILFWVIPLILFVLLLIFADALDIAVSSYFIGGKEKFQAPAWTWTIYRYGLRPGQYLFFASTIICIISCITRKPKTLVYSLYVSLCLIIGSGCIGHGLLKRYWQRPRPKQTVLYGGKYPYCPLIVRYIGPADRHLRSLPSGHATMGFYFFSVYFLGRRMKKKWVQYMGLGLSIFFGFLLSWIRLYQGGHFFSDIVCAGLIMWYTAYILDRLFYFRQDTHAQSKIATSS